MSGPDPRLASRPAAVRYRIETVHGQLPDRYRVKRTWAKDLRHLCRRLTRKILSHAALVHLAVQSGHRPLHLDARAA